MNEAILRAAGRLPREADPASTISEDDDALAVTLKHHGVAADLVDVAHGLVPEGLQGAALASAVAKLVEERPGLTTPGFEPPPRPEGLDGGSVGRGSRLTRRCP